MRARCAWGLETSVTCSRHQTVPLTPSAALEGHTVWFTPRSRAHLRAFMEQYRACKQRRPDTALALPLPASAAEQEVALLRGIRRVHRFSPGTKLLDILDLAGQPVAVTPVPVGAEVGYDTPTAGPPPSAPVASALTLPVAAALARGALPLVSAYVAPLEMTTLVDTGASHDFVSEAIVKRLHVPLRQCEWTRAHLADGGSQAILGQVTLRLTLGSLRVTVTPYVLPSFTDAAYYILDSATLRQLQAVVDYPARVLRVCKDRACGRVPLLPLSDDGLGGEEPSVNFAAAAMCSRVTLVRRGRKAAKRELRHGAHALLVRPKMLLNSVVPQPAAEPEVEALLGEYTDIFKDIPGLSPVRPVDHNIPLVPGAQPASRPMYRLELDEVKRQMTDLVAKGMVRPSTSPYSAPILFVGKEDGSLRMCIDYRGLNATTVKNRYPLPRVDDLLDKLRGAAYFSSIDLQQGYNQIRIADSDIPKTAFRTPFVIAHFEYTILSFGLVNAPATFQAVMDRIFRLYIDRFVVCYLDDILIFSKSKEEHLQHLRLVLDTLRREQLYAKRSKCHWAQAQVEYLGHVVSAEGVRMDPRTTAAVRDWPVPTSFGELRQFLGLINYFRKFIPRYSSVAAPLTDLTKKDAFFGRDAWTPACQAAAFETIKRSVTDDIVLHFPDSDSPFRVEVFSDRRFAGRDRGCSASGRATDRLCQKKNSFRPSVTTPRASKSSWPWCMPCENGAVTWRGVPLWSKRITIR
jgi:hypothetical protein